LKKHQTKGKKKKKEKRSQIEVNVANKKDGKKGGES